MSFIANTQNFYFKSMSEQLKMGNNDKISDEIMSVINEKYINFNFDILNDVDEYTNRTKYQDILEECKKNIWFFFREIIRVPVPGQPHKYNHSMRFPLNITSLEMIWCYKHKIPFFVCSDGDDKSVYTTLLLLWFYDFIINSAHDTIISNILETNEYNMNMLFSHISEIKSINIPILPRLLVLDINNLRTKIMSYNNNINKSIVKGNTNFGFDMHDRNNIFNILKLNKMYYLESFFMLEADINKIKNNDLKIFLNHLTIKMDIDYLKLNSDQIMPFKSQIFYIFNNKELLGYDNKSLFYINKCIGGENI